MFDDLYKGKRVLVTGHTGFKGSWLSAWLLSLGAEVTGFALPPAYEDSHFALLGLAGRMHHVEGDLRDDGAIGRVMAAAKPDIVFHLAAQALVRPAYADPKGTFDTNVGGAVNLLEAVRQTESVKTLVYITSDKCYRNVDWEWGYRETDTLGGRDPYSASKGCAELVFDAYWNSFLKGRLRAAAARAGNVIGGGDWATDRLIPDCIRFLRRGETIVIRSPDATRPWQHVLEPLGAYLLLGARLMAPGGDAYCKAWNFGPGHGANQTVETVVRKVIDLWGQGDLAIQRDPNAPHEDHWLQLNTDRANHYLQWEPVWGYAESITETIRWYREWQAGVDVPSFTASQIAAYEAAWKGLSRP